MVELEKIKKVLEDLKLEDIHLYDLDETNPFFNYIFVANALNKRHLKSSIDNIYKENIEYDHIEASEEWVLIDMGDIIIHILSKEARELYNLDTLYSTYSIVY